jgi:hypothetical protein
MAEAKFNIDINWYDPPKDMDIPWDGGKLTAEHDGDVIKECMKDLFSVDEYEPPSESPWSPVGKAIVLLNNNILDLFKSQVNEKNIIRTKHSSGATNRPSNLYVMQDNGSVDVVEGPKFIITPGSVLDPAGKTKKGATYILSGRANSLPLENTNRLGFSKCLNGPITCLADETKITISIPTVFSGPIVGVFNIGTFKPILDEGNSIYFQGNAIKNKLIKEDITYIKSNNPKKPQLIQANNNIKAHILMKELGDTLQVEWLKYLFTFNNNDISTSSNGRINEELNIGNSVVITTDSVVRLRAVVNKIPVIFSDMKGKSTYICPNSGAGDTLMNKAFIATMLKDLNTQNKKTFKIFEDVILEAQGLTKEDRFTWFGNSWINEDNVKKGIDILIKLVNVIGNFIKDINTRISALTDVEQAKKLVEYNTLISPFIITKSGKYKIIKMVTYLLPGSRLKFNANSFVASKIDNISNIIDLKSLKQGGGIQEGGSLEFLGLESIIVLYASTSALSGGGSSSVQPVTEFYPALNNTTHQSEQQQEIDTALFTYINYYNNVYPVIKQNFNDLDSLVVNLNTPVDYDTDTYITEIERVNLMVDTVFDSLAHGMLYCLVKEYHPEIFIYARFVSLLIDPTDILSQPNFSTMFFNTEEDYFWSTPKSGTFIRNPGYNDKEIKDLNRHTLKAMLYTQKFTEQFPNFNTSSIYTFINYFSTKFPALIAAQPSVEVDFSPLLLKEGGGKSELESAADLAIELYEPYYSLLLQKNYSPNVELHDMIKERLEFIIPFDLSTPEEYKGDSEYKESRRKILKLMIGELGTLPRVKEFMSYSRKHVTSFYKHHGSTIPSRTLHGLLEALSVHKSKSSHHKKVNPHLHVGVHGGRFSKLRITRKTRRSKERQRTTQVNRKKLKLKKN